MSNCGIVDIFSRAENPMKKDEKPNKFCSMSEILAALESISGKLSPIEIEMRVKYERPGADRRVWTSPIHS